MFRKLVAQGSLRAADPSKALLNFSPGPTSLPKAVMRRVRDELLDYDGTGLSVMELSHRSPEFIGVLEETVAAVRRVLEVPDRFRVLFCHGGGHAQMAAVPLNLCVDRYTPAVYLVSGTWSMRAAQEAAKYADVRVVANDDADYTAIPIPALDSLDEKGDGGVCADEPPPAFVYVCSNETVNGLELYRLGELAERTARRYGSVAKAPPPLVVDASSDIASKPICWDYLGVIFACTPKNIGHPGLTLTIVREDLLQDAPKQACCPSVLDWSLADASDCLFNTPATFNIYTTGKVLKWIEEEGGLAEMERRAIVKSETIYGAIDSAPGFYTTPCKVAGQRSRMNIPFDVCGGDTAVTDAFLLEAHARNMVGLRTITPFGVGSHLRASLYNAVEVDDARALASFMTEFANLHK